MEEKATFKEKIFYICAVIGGISMLMFLIISVWIGQGVKERCKIAQAKYPGECVVSLTYYLEDDQNDFRSRNSAVWALGQLGDRRALLVLEKYYTGNIPKREALGEAISQYELKKAIDLAAGGFNITHFVWKSAAF